MTRTLLAMLIEKKERATPEYVVILQQPMVIRHTAIAARTAIIWGDKDSVTPLAQAHDLHELIPTSTLSILVGVGHIPQIEDPETFNRVLVGQLMMMTKAA